MRAALLRLSALGFGAGAFAIGLAQPVCAAPFAGVETTLPAASAESVRCCRYRSNPPVYPYWYRPPTRPGGYSFYFGFVPYNRGDYESQAIQRLYPESNWPPSMRAPYPP